MRGLHVLLLGPGRIEHDGQALTRVLAPKQQALVFLLAEAGRPLPRARLATLLWGGLDDAAARGNLRGALYRLRRWLPGVLAVDGAGVGFAPGVPLHVDLHELTSALSAPWPHGRRIAAAAAWRGPLLDGFEVGDADGFEAWLSTARRRALHAAQALRRALLDEAEAGGRHDEALEHAHALLELDDADEPAHMAVMRLLAARGRRTAALAQYEACRAALLERLGARPSADCYALYTRIHADVAPPAATVPAPMASRIAPAQDPALALIGRDDDLALLLERLDDPSCRWLTIVGLGGVGKTRLALCAASARAARHRHGVLHLSARDDAGGALLDAATLLQHVTGRTGADRDRPGALLLVLDELEALPAARELAPALRERAPGVQVLATSRTRIGDAREWLLPLDGLATQPRHADDPCSSDAAALFVATARRLQPRFEAAAQGAAIARLCRQLGGLPLALELAARRACDAGVDTVLAQLDRGRLPADTDAADARHRSVEQVLAESWARLGDAARDAALRLACLPAGVDAALAETVGVDAQALATLRTHCWLAVDASSEATIDATPGVQRLALHPLQRRFLRAQPPCAALEPGVLDALVRRLDEVLPVVPAFGGLADVDDATRSRAAAVVAASIGTASTLADAAARACERLPPPQLAPWVDRAALALEAADRQAEAAALFTRALTRTDLPPWLAVAWTLRRAESLMGAGDSRAALRDYRHAYATLGMAPEHIESAPWVGLATAALRVATLRDWPAAGPARDAFAALMLRSGGGFGEMLAFFPDPQPWTRHWLVNTWLLRRLGAGATLRRLWTAMALGGAGRLGLMRRAHRRAQRLERPVGGLEHAMAEYAQGMILMQLGDWRGLVARLDAVADAYGRWHARRYELGVRALAGKLLFFQGRLAEAHARFAQLAEIALARPGDAWRAWGPVGLVEIGLCLGVDDHTLQRQYRRAADAMTEIENIDAAYTLRRHGLAARLAWRRGDVDAAWAAVRTGVASSARMRCGWWGHEGYAALGDTLLALQRHAAQRGERTDVADAAWAEFEPALGRQVRLFAPAAILRARLQGQRACLQQRHAEGVPLLQRAFALAEAQGMGLEQARAAEALAQEAAGDWPERAGRLWARLRTAPA